METPFREAGLDPSPIAATDALAKLEAAEPVPLISQIAFYGTKEFERVEGDPIAEPTLRTEAETLHFTYFGNFARVSDEEIALHRECWIDETATVLVTLRSAEEKIRFDLQGPRSPGDTRSARYMLTTMFHDGSIFSTWSHGNSPLKSVERLRTFDGTGDLAVDYADHLRRANEHSLSGRRALQISDLASALRVRAWEDDRLRRSDAKARILGAIVTVVGLVLIAILLCAAYMGMPHRR
jgi:hypothetical protein